MTVYDIKNILKERDFYEKHPNIIVEELEEIVKDGTKRNREIEEKAKKELARIFGEELSVNRINYILKKNGFKGIYVLDDELFESLFPEEIAKYLYEGEKAIFISKKYYKRIEVLTHELTHALINHGIKTLCKNEEFDLLYEGIEEGIATCVSKLALGKNLNSKATYYPLEKLMEQINELYRCNKKRKYRNFILHAILEPEDVIPHMKEIYSGIISKKIIEDREVENVEYKTAYNLLSTANDYLKNKSKKAYYIMSYINFLYYAFNNEILMLNDCPDEITELFELSKSKLHKIENERYKELKYADKYYLSIFESIIKFNDVIPNIIEKNHEEQKRR